MFGAPSPDIRKSRMKGNIQYSKWSEATFYARSTRSPIFDEIFVSRRVFSRLQYGTFSFREHPYCRWTESEVTRKGN